VVDGVEVARERRGGAADRELARGPARLCVALGLDLTHNTLPLTGPELRLEPGPEVPEIRSGPRVGLRLAADRPWRFWLPGEPTVSAYRAAVRRR
jgi:DNA-3-methyladenine glycosylase